MADGLFGIIGNTPLVRLTRVIDAPFRLFGKLEGANPGGSSKDRPAANILRHAMQSGAIDGNSVVIESSSGNMGIGLAQACAYYGLPFICVVDPKATKQNLRILEAYGARIDLVTSPDPESGEFLVARLKRVKSLLASIDNSFWPNQYANECNAGAHYRTTIEEIVRDLGGELDYLFCATSTCGTIMGCAQLIRERGMTTKVIAVDAVGSAIFGGEQADRRIPGLGAGIKPPLCQTELIDDCIHVSDLECVIGCRRLVRDEAILVGGSSGGVLMAIESMKHRIPPRSTCVGVFADRGERYLDTVYSDEWVSGQFGNVLGLWQPWEDEPCLAATS
ncbi:MAG: 2,3-diaminopropionate biosynthesis protein SbnA [Gammaproteobacteria bacterium]|nr:2,3-diaminopropionate biosynthesis protein SbnA [Gammaproteobacteria bacterium]